MLCVSLGAVSSREWKSLVYQKRMKPQPRLREWGAWVDRKCGRLCLQREKVLGMVRSPWKDAWSDERRPRPEAPSAPTFGKMRNSYS